jgi:diguanylate cyclase (GGDEF)-like protein
MSVSHRRVEREADFVQALRNFSPDVIVSDFSMGGFDGMQALSLARELAPEIPFIFVSGTLGEEYAIRALKSGAHDYVLKTNLIRLVPAVERALLESQQQRERRRIETELHIARERLQERETALIRAQHMARLAHIVSGPRGSFKTWSDNLHTLIGVERAGVPRTTREWQKRVHPADRPRLIQASTDAATGRRVELDYRFQHGSVGWIHLRQTMEPLPDADGESRWFNTLQDISEHQRAQASIKRLNRVYAVLSGINALILRATHREALFQEACRLAVEVGELQLAWIGIYDRDKRAVVPAAWHGHNEGFLRLISLSRGDPIPEGHSLVSLTLREKRALVINDLANDTKFQRRKEALERGYAAGAVLPLIIGGEVIGVFSLFAGEPHFFDEQELRLLADLAADIAFAVDHIAKAEKLEYLALYDGLTSAANRTLFLDRLGHSMHTARETKSKLAIMVCDLERFRAVNDSLGRQTGDLLLMQFYERMVAKIPDRTRLSRLGADHFAIAFPSVNNELDAARQLADLANGALGQPFHVGASELRMSAKAGLAIFPNDGADADTLLRNAEIALKRCKKSGERYLFFEPRMGESVAANLSLENRLRRALERDEFVLHYQPRVDFQERRVQGVEALIRWQSEEGLVPPGKFIPLLEETGLILQVGAWALKRAVLQHAEWLRQGIAAPRVAVNVSAVQLHQKDFVAMVRRTIATGANPPGLDLEITESKVMDNLRGNMEKLSAARDLGLNIAIDDFGTGYSSLAYLAKLPVASLKIDRSFIITMLKDSNTMNLVTMMISLGHSLHLKVVAEGVDSEDQAQVLHRLGCDEMQGYLFSKPLPADQLIALLTDRSKG